jgi:hypothetical protein
MTVVTACALSKKGISVIERILQEADEVVISVRGKPRQARLFTFYVSRFTYTPSFP